MTGNFGLILKTISALFVFLVFISVAHAEKRVALVVGNSDYQAIGVLPNPVNDADRLGKALEDLEFAVIREKNLDQAAFQAAIRQFAQALKGADVALFFYAGHGIQVEGENYLLPTDTRLESEDQIASRLISLKSVISQMAREAKTKIVLLDACRNNPFAPGLARSMGKRSVMVGQGLAEVDADAGTLIAYATEPGNVALDGEDGNSPFTKALLGHVASPGLDVARMMRRVRTDVIEATGGAQIPWENSSLTNDFSFNTQSGASLPVSGDQALWEAVRSGGSPDEVRLYLERFPNGAFAKEALALLNGVRERPQVSISKTEDRKARASEAGYVKACLSAETADLGAGVAEETVQACFDAVAHYPNSALLRLLYGRVLDRTGDESEAARQYRQSAELKNTDAMVELAVAYDLGKGVEWQPEETLRLLEKAAEAGNPEAMNLLANIYAEGNIVDYDEEKSFHWFLKAAEAGDTEAAFYAGSGYELGEGTEANAFRARHWYQIAADAGDTLAATNLGMMFVEGRGGDRNLEHGRVLLERAAAAEDVLAMRELAKRYLDGTFASEDVGTAADWAMKAIRQGGRIEAEIWFLNDADRYPPAFNKAVQRHLKDAGTYRGKIDGKFGENSLQALFQYADQ